MKNNRRYFYYLVFILLFSIANCEIDKEPIKVEKHILRIERNQVSCTYDLLKRSFVPEESNKSVHIPVELYENFSESKVINDQFKISYNGKVDWIDFVVHLSNEKTFDLEIRGQEKIGFISWFSKDLQINCKAKLIKSESYVMN